MTYMSRETSHDGKRRPSHKAMQGRICKYSDNSVYLDEQSGKWVKRATIGGVELAPAEDYNCRCIARLYVKGL